MKDCEVSHGKRVGGRISGSTDIAKLIYISYPLVEPLRRTETELTVNN